MSYFNIARVNPRKAGIGTRRTPTFPPTNTSAPPATKPRRAKTSQFPHDDAFPQNPATLKSHVFSEISRRLQEVSVVTSQMDPLLFEFISPKSGAEYWERLLTVPIGVTDIEVNSILTLEVS